jgi:hypothetical protein
MLPTIGIIPTHNIVFTHRIPIISIYLIYSAGKPAFEVDVSLELW